MKSEEIKEHVESYLRQALAGNFEENEKFDFKSKWYNIKSEEGVYEFLKDTSAIVNTVGPDGYIVIGYDEKSKRLVNSKFADSGLNDTNELLGVINKRVNRPFRIDYISLIFDSYELGVLHIPPSLDKPHVLKNYKYFKKGKQTREEEHRIFVRKGTTTKIATKYDLDLMNYDKKNIQPEYRLFSSVNYYKIYNSDGRLQLETLVILENTGTRPMAISDLRIAHNTHLNWQPKLIFEKALIPKGPGRPYKYLKNKNILLKSNDIVEFGLHYKLNAKLEREGIDEIMNKFLETKDLTLQVVLSNGKFISTVPIVNAETKSSS